MNRSIGVRACNKNNAMARTPRVSSRRDNRSPRAIYCYDILHLNPMKCKALNVRMRSEAEPESQDWRFENNENERSAQIVKDGRMKHDLLHAVRRSV